MSRAPTSYWNVPLAVHDVPLTGRHLDLVADTATRAALAQALGLRELPRLEAHFDVSRSGGEGLRVAGTVSATVGQTCVVTLEPIDNAIEEGVDLVFVPMAPVSDRERVRRDLSVTAEDAPEPLVNGTVDLGAIAVEFLTLAIDPYPRKPGVEFAAPESGDESGHPFAALATLKKRLDGDK